MIRINNVSSYTCTGPRTNQEDYIIANDKSRIYVLCDGMGGHGHGEVASKTVAESVYNYLSELKPEEYSSEQIQDAINFGLEEIKKVDNFNDERAMGTTIVVIAINRMNIIVGHIGDSRCYQFSIDGLKKYRSKDHSKVQEAVDAEILTEEEAWCSPKKNILTRCITSEQTSVEVEIDIIEIEDNDVVLLCSDGVTDALKDTQLQSIIMGRPIEETASLIKTECELYSRDNFSLILISFSQDEKNSPHKPVVRIQHSDENKYSCYNVSFCPHCGKGINSDAVFCPDCGKGIIHDKNRISIQTSAKSNFLSFLKDIDPIWLIAGGFIVGSILTCTIYSLFSTNDELVVDTPIIMGHNVVTEDDINNFISSVCEIDSANPNDTIIVKKELESNYRLFIKKINDKN